MHACQVITGKPNFNFIRSQQIPLLSLLCSLISTTSRLCRHVLEYNQISKFALKSKLGEVAVRLKPKAKESGEPVFISNNNQASKGRKGWDLQNFRTVEVSNFAIQLGMRHRTFTRPFIVRVLSQGKPMKNTVLQNRTCT